MFSFDQAHRRLAAVKRTRESEDLQATDDARVMSLYRVARKGIELDASQVGDERPLGSLRVHTAGGLVATASLGSAVKIWDASSMQLRATLRGHEERVTALDWLQQDGSENTRSNGELLASSSADTTCRLWQIGIGSDENGNTSTQLQVLRGHQAVVTDCAWYPAGKLCGTSSADFTWRLWDVETASELLLQDGHGREVTCLGFQRDGALSASGDSGGLALVWDLRSGQSICPLQQGGHVQKVVALHWSSDGYHVATCSVDNSVRVWDLRHRRCEAVLPAHVGAVTDVRYAPSGELLATSSFDGTVRVWGTRDWRLLRSLAGHAGKVMACDFDGDHTLFSAGFDRTFKRWTADESESR